MRRLNIELPDELFDELNTLIPNGLRRRVVTPLLEQLAAALRNPQTRQVVLGGLLSGALTAQQLLIDAQVRKATVASQSEPERINQ